MVARVLILTIVASGTLAGCKKQSEKWCEMHPFDLEHCGYVIDARPVCGGDPDCAGSPAAPYCELTGGVCVECYNDTHCAGKPETPFCDETTFLCTSCVTNADCAASSGVCLPSGVCGDDSNIAYVDAATGVDNASCTKAEPCETIAAGLLTKKPFVRLQGMILEKVVVAAQTVTFVADPGTTLTPDANGVAIVVTDGADLSIFGLTIIGKSEKGINVDMNSTLHLTSVTVTGCNTHDRPALEAKDATILIDRSTIYANAGGGIKAAASAIYQITNTFIYRNGDGSMIGGAVLLHTSTAFNRFEFNTVIDNKATAAVAGGVQCEAKIAAPNNIVVRNFSGVSNLDTTQTGPLLGCNFAQSLKGTDVEQYAFVMPDGIGPWDLHVTAGSMAIDRGVASDIHIDVDGDMRPLGPKVDVGADEFLQ